MTLHVSFDQFAETVKRVLGTAEAYLNSSLHGTYVTAVHASQEKLVSARSPLPLDEAKKRLEQAGLKVHEGSWTLDGEAPANTADMETLHVAAVSYLSGGDQPGVWVDAFPSQPATVQVLRALYEEFRANGEIAEVSFEEFVRLAKPNVAVVTPVEIAGYLESKEPNC